MNTFDPCAPEMAEQWPDREFTVDEVAQMVAYAEQDVAAKPEEVEEGVPAEEAVEAVPIHPIGPIQPVVPIQPVMRRVSGRYRSCRGSWELLLRVDVDGRRPMKRVSGDYFRPSGATLSYFGSFVVDAIDLKVTSTLVVIEGLATTTWSTSYNKIRVTIARHNVFMPPAVAHVQWMTPQGKMGASYTCVFESPYFRTVDFEQDHEENVTPFVSYNTGSLPSGGSGRTLDVVKSYAEAGIEMRTVGKTNVVSTSEAGGDIKWSNAELHDAMETHFSLWKDVPQWKVWLFHAMRHEIGPGLLGIMFDQKGKQRQGCAVFYQGVGGQSNAQQREQLYTCVHELGHCFNLYHSFHKKYMNPPQPNRLRALSWMNYPWKFPDGAAAFWSAFDFQFDNPEVVHLRHAFRNNVIIGGNPFGTGAALEDPGAFADLVEDNSGLRLELEARGKFAFGEPVVTEIKLYMTDQRGKQVHKELHPNFGFVQIAIQKPSGEVMVYHPPMEHCIETEMVELTQETPAVYESAYIGYDRDHGQIFDQPGSYRLRAVYYSMDGSVVLSNVMPIWVQVPVTQREEELAELFLGDEQGMLLYLLGSDSKYLKNGRDAFELVLDKHPDTQMAVYAQLVKGYNLARPFASLTPEYTLKLREPQVEEAESLLSEVVKASEKDKGVDNITLNQTMRHLASAQIEAGQTEEGTETIERMVKIFSGKDLNPHVMETIKAQAAAVKEKA